MAALAGSFFGLMAGGGLSWFMSRSSLVTGEACVPDIYDTTGVYYEVDSAETCVKTSDCIPNYVLENGVCKAYTSGGTCGTVTNGTKTYDSSGQCILTCDTGYQKDTAGTGCELIRKHVSNIIIENATTTSSNAINLEEITLYDVDDTIIDYSGSLGSIFVDTKVTDFAIYYDFGGLEDNKIHPFNTERVFPTSDNGIPLSNTVPLPHTLEGPNSNVLINVPLDTYVSKIRIVNRGEFIDRILDKKITIKGSAGVELSNISFTTSKNVYEFLIDDAGVITENTSFDPPYYAIPGRDSGIPSGYVSSNVVAVVNGMEDDNWTYTENVLQPKQIGWKKGRISGLTYTDTYASNIAQCFSSCDENCTGAQYTVLDPETNVSRCYKYNDAILDDNVDISTDVTGNKWYYTKDSSPS